MSATVIAHWSPKPHTCMVGQAALWQLLENTCRAFGADFRLVDIYSEMPFEYPKYVTLENALEGLDGQCVVLTPDRHATFLQDFSHPEDAVYILGPDYADAPFASPVGTIPVHIATPVPVQLWAVTALAIALYDRQEEEW